VISIANVNRQLVEQDTDLRAGLEALAAQVDDPSLRALAAILVTGIAALHERQGNAILLKLQSAS